jgi:hypothetical protein
MHNRWLQVLDHVILRREGMELSVCIPGGVGKLLDKDDIPSEYDPGIMCFVPGPEALVDLKGQAVDGIEWNAIHRNDAAHGSGLRPAGRRLS